MRILIYGINFAPELTGIGKFTGEMAAFLAEKGHEVRVITAPPYYPQWRIAPPYSGSAYKKEIWKGMVVYRCPLWVPRRTSGRSRKSGMKRILHLSSFALSSLPVSLSQVPWRPERVISLAPAIANAPVAAWVARLSGGKSWLHIQDFELDAAIGLNMLSGGGLFQRLAQKGETLLYHSFDRISTISNRMLSHLWEKGVARGQRTLLFPNWVDVHQIFPLDGDDTMRQRLSLDDRRQIVLYSGNMGQKQGLDVVVEAARRLVGEANLLFLLCGDGAPRSQLETLAQGLPNVRFLPLQPLDELNHLLNLADIHVLPQCAGAADLVMPSKLSGMLASGRPVIVTACPGTELASVMEELGIVVPPGDAEALAGAILELIQKPEVRVELGLRGRRFVEKTWAKDVILNQFCSDLQAL